MTVLSEEKIFSSLLDASRSAHHPQVGNWHPVRCGSIAIHIAADGVWRHQGTPFRRPEIVRLLGSILRREEDRYYLVTPQEKLLIEVEDTPFLVVDFHSSGQGQDRRLLMTANNEDHILVSKANRLFLRPFRGQPLPCLQMRNQCIARVDRGAYYRLVDLALREMEQDGKYRTARKGQVPGIWSCGVFFPLLETG